MRNTTTMNELKRIQKSFMLKYKDHIIFTKSNNKGQRKTGVYEFIDSTLDFYEEECRLNLIEYTEEKFKNTEKAIDWAMDKLM